MLHCERCVWGTGKHAKFCADKWAALQRTFSDKLRDMLKSPAYQAQMREMIGEIRIR